jgi:hypothetical protein
MGDLEGFENTTSIAWCTFPNRAGGAKDGKETPLHVFLPGFPCLDLVPR